MFESIDHLRDTAIRKPRNAILAPLSVLLIGVWVGTLIGKRNGDLLEWLGVAMSMVLLWMIFGPILRGFYKFLKDGNAH